MKFTPAASDEIERALGLRRTNHRRTAPRHRRSASRPAARPLPRDLTVPSPARPLCPCGNTTKALVPLKSRHANVVPRRCSDPDRHHAATARARPHSRQSARHDQAAGPGHQHRRPATGDARELTAGERRWPIDRSRHVSFPPECETAPYRRCSHEQTATASRSAEPGAAVCLELAGAGEAGDENPEVGASGAGGSLQLGQGALRGTCERRFQDAVRACPG